MTQHRSHPNLGPSDPSSHARPQLPGQDTNHIQFKPQTAYTTLFNGSIMQSTDIQGNSPWSAQQFWAPQFLVFATCKNAFGLQGQEKGKIKDKPHCIDPRGEFVIISCSIFYLEA